MHTANWSDLYGARTEQGKHKDHKTYMDDGSVFELGIARDVRRADRPRSK